MKISRKNKYYYIIVYFNFSVSSRWCWRSKILWKTDSLLTIQPVLYRCKQAQEILILNMSFSCEMRISEWSHSQEILILNMSFSCEMRISEWSHSQEILILNMSFSCQMRISEWSHSQEILILHQSFLSLLMAILRADWLEDNQFPRGSWTFNITYWTQKNWNIQ